MNYRKVEINGCRVELWECKCNDCGFLTGLAEITRPDGSRALLSGAGCFSKPKRRGPKEALEWVMEKTRYARHEWLCENCEHINEYTLEFFVERAEACGDEEVDYNDTCECCARGVWDVREQPKPSLERPGVRTVLD